MAFMGKSLVSLYALLAAAAASESTAPFTFVQNSSGLRKDGEIWAVLRGNIADKEDLHVNAPTNLTERDTDVFSHIIHPETLQPWYIIPLANCIKAVITLIVFGFDIPFKQQNGRFKWTTFSRLWHYGTTLPFILLALNSWAHDLKAGWNAPGPTFFTRTCARIILCATSPNYVAALSVWGALAIQSPARALNLRPKYKYLIGVRLSTIEAGWCNPLKSLVAYGYNTVLELSGIGFPLSPTRTVWLKPMKWWYAVFLFPYLAMDPVISVGLNVLNNAIFFIKCFFLGEVWNYFSGFCCCIWTSFKACIFFVSSLIAIIFTLCQWSYAYNCTHYWSKWLWEGGWPILYFLLLDALSRFVIPLVFTSMYACWLSSSFRETMEAVLKEASDVDMYKSLPGALSLQTDDRETLIQFNHANLDEDFEWEENESGGPSDHRLQDAMIAIINSTLKFVGTVLIKQLVCIWSSRVLSYMASGQTNLSDYWYRPGQNCLFIEGLKLTLGERSWTMYRSTLESKLSTISRGSKYAYLLWGLM